MPEDVDTLAKQLTEGSDADRAAAAESLARMGREAAPAAVALVRACGSRDDSTREWAAAALEELGPPPTAQIDELIPLVGHQSTGVEYWAITLLGRAGQEAAPAVGVLVKMLGSNADVAVRERSAWALGKIGPAAKAAIPTLRAAAAGEQARLARLASDALTAIGE